VGSSHTLERRTRLALTKPQIAQRSESLPVCFHNSRIDGTSVAAAIGVFKSKTSGNTSLDNQLPAVLCPVMCGAKNDQRVLVVVAALGTEHDVVDVDERSVTTSRNDAPPSVAPHHFATSRRRDVLVSTPCPHVGGGGRIDATQFLRIASCHLDNFSSHFHLFPAPLLPTAPTPSANRQRHLVISSTVVLGTDERVASQQQHRRVVIERLASVAPKLGQRFSKGRQRFCSDFNS